MSISGDVRIGNGIGRRLESDGGKRAGGPPRRRIARGAAGLDRLQLVLQAGVLVLEAIDVVLELAVFGVDRFNVRVDVRRGLAAGEGRQTQGACQCQTPPVHCVPRKRGIPRRECRSMRGVS